MDAYVFQAALLCACCAKKIMDRTPCRDSEDSDVFPQGPYSDGGGEADCPQHCDSCNIFLENPLTSDGYAYVRELAADPSSHSSVIREWMDFYDIESED